jgi:hypothetical protein
MAAVTPTGQYVHSFATSQGPKTSTQTVPGSLRTCIFECAFTGTYAQATGYSITSAQIIAAINATQRDGGTITIWDVSAIGPGQEGATNAWVMPGPAIFTTSAGPCTGLLYGQDMATEHAAAVMGTFGSPCAFMVTFLDAAAL